MARKVNPEGKAKVHTFSCPDNKFYDELFQAIRLRAKEKNLSESQFIMRLLKSYYEKFLISKTP